MSVTAVLAKPRLAAGLGFAIALLSFPFNITALLYGWWLIANLASPHFADNHHAPDYLAALVLHLSGYLVLAGLGSFLVRHRSLHVRSAVLLATGVIYSIAVVVFLISIGPINL